MPAESERSRQAGKESRVNASKKSLVTLTWYKVHLKFEK